MTSKEKLVYLAAVPLLAAAIGGAAVYVSKDDSDEQVIITGDAAKAAKDGQLTVRIIREDKGPDYTVFAIPLGIAAFIFGLGFYVWALTRNE